MNKIIIIMFAASLLVAQGEHPTKTKKAEHPTTRVKELICRIWQRQLKGL